MFNVADRLREREELLRAYPLQSLWFNNTRGTAYQLLDITFDVDDDTPRVTYAAYSVILSRPSELHLSVTLPKFLSRYTRKD